MYLYMYISLKKYMYILWPRASLEGCRTHLRLATFNHCHLRCSRLPLHSTPTTYTTSLLHLYFWRDFHGMLIGRWYPFTSHTL